MHRSLTDGQTWTWSEQLLYQLIRTTHDNTARITHALSGKKGSKPQLIKDSEWPRFPWAEPASKRGRIGDLGGRSGEEVVAFLDSLG